ncbi:hypothetical protein [Actomonas aquatica]|uniref:Uncharacterized protein n=1 Tax=Actomonas aquatica TaxID=2866162 RepID=A0ABZ1CFN5_9BACT|nr:hypothetical protein [Opitutus sp. WL0086]WRQ89379.1 hypothetical protein K1X11_008155 [Opitutus sp. WL0086]
MKTDKLTSAKLVDLIEQNLADLALLTLTKERGYANHDETRKIIQHARNCVADLRYTHVGLSLANLSSIIELIAAEVARATRKFPVWPTDPLHAVGVVGEEFGELQKEVLQLTYEPQKSSKEAVRIEAVQLAAMSIRFLLSLDRYEYQPQPQHTQKEGGES